MSQELTRRKAHANKCVKKAASRFLSLVPNLVSLCFWAWGLPAHVSDVPGLGSLGCSGSYALPPPTSSHPGIGQSTPWHQILLQKGIDVKFLTKMLYCLKETNIFNYTLSKLLYCLKKTNKTNIWRPSAWIQPWACGIQADGLQILVLFVFLGQYSSFDNV